MSWLSTMAPGLPLLLAGDLNAEPEERVLAELLVGAGLQSAYPLQSTPHTTAKVRAAGQEVNI